MHAKISFEKTRHKVIAAPWSAIIATVAIALIGIVIAFFTGGAMPAIIGAASTLLAFAIVFGAVWAFYWVREPLQAQLALKDETIKALNENIKALNDRLATIETKNTEIAALKKQIEVWQQKHPKLTITFRDNDDAFFRGGWYFIVVTSDSKGSTAHETAAHVVDLKKMGKRGDEDAMPLGTNDLRPFPWVMGTEKDLPALAEIPVSGMQSPHFELHPGGSRPIPVVTYVPERQAIRLGGFGWSGGLFLEKGAYRIRIRATGMNSRAAEIRLIVGMNDSGKLICEIDKSRPSISQQAAHATGDDHSPDSTPDQRTVQDRPAAN